MGTPELLCGGRFQLTKQLGEGGMAVVHQAYDHRLQVWRAIKTLHPDYASRRKLRQRFLGEAQAMARLEHKNIVRVYDVGEDGPVVYIVMELVDGGALEDWIATHKLMPPRLAVRCLLDVCAGITAAHEQGIIHRDIKPHNVLVDRNGVCKVTDFGIAQVKDTTGQMTRTGTVMGTLGFMAPEQRTDSKHIDERADVYSLGASLFSLVTGRTSMDLFAADQDDSILDGVLAELQDVIIRACRYHPEQRYESVDAFAAAIRGLLPQLPPDPADTPPIVQRARALPEPPVLPDSVDTSTFNTEVGGRDTGGQDATEIIHASGAQQQAAEPSPTARNRIRAGFEDEMPASAGTLAPSDALRRRDELDAAVGEEEISKTFIKAVKRALQTLVEYAIGEGFLVRFLLPLSVIVVGFGVWLNLGAGRVDLAQAEFEQRQHDYVVYVLTDASGLAEELLAAGVAPGLVQSHIDDIERTKKQAQTLLEQLDAADRFVEAADGSLAGLGFVDPKQAGKVKKARAHVAIMVEKRAQMSAALDAWHETAEGTAASAAIELGLADAPPG